MSAQEDFEGYATEHEPGVSRRRMFGRDGLRVNGTFFAFLNRDRLVVKLPPARTAALIAAGEARVATDLSPTMLRWISVPLPAIPADANPWHQLMAEAHAYATQSWSKPNRKG